MNSRILILIVAVIFLFTHGGCAGLNKTGMQTNTAYSENFLADRESQMEKSQKEWLIAVLLILGVAIVAGAAISASSGSGGLSVGINN